MTTNLCKKDPWELHQWSKILSSVITKENKKLAFSCYNDRQNCHSEFPPLTTRPRDLGSRNNCFSKIQPVSHKYLEKTTLASKTRFSRHCFGFQSRLCALPAPGRLRRLKLRAREKKFAVARPGTLASSTVFS